MKLDPLRNFLYTIWCSSPSSILLTLICLIADREVQRILLELLNQMDGFDQTVNVKVRSVTCKL